jgi:hypothetical protein
MDDAANAVLPVMVQNQPPNLGVDNKPAAGILDQCFQ